MKRIIISLVFAGPVALAAAAQDQTLDQPPVDARIDPPVRCADFLETRNAYWGELHVHTSFSQDALGLGVNATPVDVYEEGRQRLDFLAVTDHSEFLGEVSLCTTPGSPGFDSPACESLRVGDLALANTLCKNAEPTLDPQLCAEQADGMWTRVRKAAALHDDACEFTTLIGYEYTLDSRIPGAGLVGGGNEQGQIATDDPQDATRRHRNIIFRSDSVAKPVSAYDAPSLGALWAALDARCLPGRGCELLSIPHQLNTSRGFAFSTREMTGLAISTENLLRQGRFESLVEVFQHKGASECHPDYASAVDTQCDFELLEPDQMQNDEGVVPESSFARFGLREGMRLQSELGFNPFRFGMTAGTDAHSGLGGNTDEGNWQGHTGSQDTTPKKRLNRGALNPGGLTAVWARENTRDEIFDALARREVYATSGTRPLLRFFGGWHYTLSDCTANMAAQGYAKGTAMGGIMSAPQAQYPTFMVSMQRDPASSAIQEVQIIKAWLNADGSTDESLVTIFRSPTSDGVGQGCVLWEDKSYQAGQASVYYARLLEAPVDRWSTYDCAAGAVDCSDPQVIEQGYERCCDGTLPEQIQERAWSSPIWIDP